jgi:hypothetical protein
LLFCYGPAQQLHRLGLSAVRCFRPGLRGSWRNREAEAAQHYRGNIGFHVGDLDEKDS